MKISKFVQLVVTILLVSMHATSVQAAKRIGLVIGNDTYAHVPVLEKARADASAISEALTKVGFDITKVLDADRSSMNRAISTFIGKLQPGDTAFVFFAGHGVEISGQNYLLPTNIDASANASEDFIKSEAIGLSNVLSRVQSTGARITLMFIDACRDNPFKGAAGRSIGGTRGLARITAPEGTFVVFSAGAGQQALDRLQGPDDNPNSVFTRTLLPRLTEGGLELREMVSKVRLQVRETALTQNHRQFPAYYDELLGKFYFKPGTELPAREETKTNDKIESAATGTSIQSDFDQVKSLNSVPGYQAFLEKYSDQSNILVDIAKQRLALLLSEAKESTAAGQKQPELTQDTEVTAPKEPVKPEEDERRAVILASQKRLNALGCNVGKADGISGPRTRSAFRQFISETGIDLRVSDFGTRIALDQLNSASGTICSPVIAEKKPRKEDNKPTTKTVEITPEETVVAALEPPKPASLAGTWSFRAKCPLAIRARGTTVYRSLGGNRYSVVTTDNFKNVGKGVTTDIGGGVLAVSIVWQDGANDNYNARLSGDRRTITGKNYAGCRFTAQKQD